MKKIIVFLIITISFAVIQTQITLHALISNYTVEDSISVQVDSFILEKMIEFHMPGIALAILTE